MSIIIVTNDQKEKVLFMLNLNSYQVWCTQNCIQNSLQFLRPKFNLTTNVKEFNFPINNDQSTYMTLKEFYDDIEYLEL